MSEAVQGLLLILGGFALLFLAKYLLDLTHWYKHRGYTPSSMVYNKEKKEFRER